MNGGGREGRRETWLRGWREGRERIGRNGNKDREKGFEG